MTFADVVLAATPVAYYRFLTSPFADSSGNGHDGSTDGGFFNTEGAPIIIDGDPTNMTTYFGGARMSVPYDVDFATDFLTVSAAYYANDPADQCVIERAGAFSLYHIDGLYEARVTLADTTVLVATGTEAVIYDGYQGALVTMTYDGTALRLYVDGVEVASAAGVGVLAKPTTPITIAGTEAYDFLFTGLMDEVAIFDYALDIAEISAHSIQAFGLAVKFVSTSTVIAEVSPRGDDFPSPIQISGAQGTITVDMTDATLAEFEELSVVDGVDRNIWFHYFPPESDDTEIRFTSSHPTAAVTFYDYSGLWTMAEDVDGDLDETLPVGEYLIQVGLYPGDDDSFALEWSTVEEQVYNSSDTPIQIASDYGYESVTISNGLPAWLTWEADSDDEVEYTFVGTPSVNYTVTVYLEDQTTVVTTVTGAGALAFTLSPTVDAVYFMEITSSDSVTVELSWSSAPVIEDPSPPYEYLRLEVYERDGITKITELPRRSGVSFLEPLNEVGAGEFSIRMDDPLFDEYPDMLDWGNIVKIWLGPKCVHGFRVKQRSTVFVSEAEWSGFVRRIAGPSVHHLLDDFQVRHNLPLQDRRLAERGFFWGSLVTDDLEDDWFRPGKWNDLYNVSSQDDPPSFVNTDMAAEDKPKFGNPPNFPDKNAKWLWISSREELNNDSEGEHFNPPALDGVRYYRKDFNTSKTEVVRIYASADERYTIYLDGEELLSGDGHETGYNETQRRKFIIRPGRHTLAVKQRTKGQTKGDGVDAFIMTLMRLNAKDKPTTVIVRTNDSWITTWERPVPTWNRAYVLRTLVQEAQSRGVEAAGALNIGFTGRRDSRNKRWKDRYDEFVTVGESVLVYQGLLSEENGFDVWVDPETMILKAWNRRGKNRSTSVTLEPGRNLVNFSIDETDDGKNDFLIRYDGGWTRFKAQASKARLGTRETYIELGKAKNDRNAERIVRKASNGVAWAQKRAGTSDIVKRPEGTPQGGLIAVDGARPFLDFEVGDTIKAPNVRGVLTKHRVMSIACTEDEEGRLSYDPELEEVD